MALPAGTPARRQGGRHTDTPAERQAHTMLLTRLVQVRARDADAGANARVSYALAEESPVFVLDGASGALTLQGALDRESKDTYSVPVYATDQGQPALSSLATVVIIVEDVNDHSPSLAPPFEFEIPENAAPALIGSLRHEDRDVGRNADVTYSRLWTDQEAFSLSENGSLFSTRPLDREEKDRHCLRVRLRDNGVPARRQGTGQLCVRVTDLNDNRPRLINPRGLLATDDLSTPGPSQAVSLSMHESPGHLVARLMAIDNDDSPNARITYSMQLPGRLQPPLLLHLNRSSGSISLARSLRSEQLGLHRIRVSASDSGSPPLSDEKVLYLHITDQPAKAHKKAATPADSIWMDRNSLFVVIILSTISLSFAAMLVTAILCMLKPCYQRHLVPPHKPSSKHSSTDKSGPARTMRTQDNILSSLQETLLMNGGSEICSSFLNTCPESTIDMKPFVSRDNQTLAENEGLGYMVTSSLQRYQGSQMMGGVSTMPLLEYGMCSQCPAVHSYGSHTYATFGRYVDISREEEPREDHQSDSGQGASEDDTYRRSLARRNQHRKLSTFKDKSGDREKLEIPMTSLSRKLDSAGTDLCQVSYTEKYAKPDLISNEINELFFQNLIKP